MVAAGKGSYRIAVDILDKNFHPHWPFGG